MAMNLSGKRCIITGAAQGIGAAIAERFAAEGADVAVADIAMAAAEETAGRLRAFGNQALALEVDVSSSPSVQRMIGEAAGSFGGIDVLINNAAIVRRDDTEIELTPEDAWDATIAVNLKGVFLCSKFAIPAMLASGGGAIVNIASIVALAGSYPAQIAYTASKGGVMALSREMAVCLARRGIRVNAICPGPTQTPMAAGLIQDHADFELRRLHIPMGRMGEPYEIAAMAAFLASDEASYITGQAFPVDGGLTSAYLTPPDQQ